MLICSPPTCVLCMIKLSKLQISGIPRFVPCPERVCRCQPADRLHGAAQLALTILCSCARIVVAILDTRCIDTDAEADPLSDPKPVLGLLHSIASVLFGAKMTLCALQLWLADTPSAHNSSYNVCNGERPQD